MKKLILILFLPVVGSFAQTSDVKIDGQGNVLNSQAINYATGKLKVNGVAVTSGGVTSVTGTAPIVSSGGTTPAISITAATTSNPGSMSAADKTKLNAITGTNTGDQTSIVGITGTLAQFDTALTDANFARRDAAQTFTGDQTFSRIYASGVVGSLIGQLNVVAPGTGGAPNSQSSINFQNANDNSGYFIGHGLDGNGDHNFFWYDRLKNESPIYLDGSGSSNVIYIGSAPGVTLMALGTPGNVVIGGSTDDATNKLQVTGSVKASTDIKARAFISIGTATTCTGATIGTGSKSNAGFVTATTTGVSTVVMTFPATAPTGWAISPQNNTTANMIRQTASSTTTATFVGTTVSGDVISYIAMAY